MGLFSRVKRLEDDMFQRKIDEKLEEYNNKYKRKFTVSANYYGYYLLINGDRMGYLTSDECFVTKEKIYNRLCGCEDEIKVYLFDEMWGKENAQAD